MIIKDGDRYAVTFVANMDLAGTATRLLARRPWEPGPPLELVHTVTDQAGGVVTHVLDGSLMLLPSGNAAAYDIELEVTAGTKVVTFPTRQDTGVQFVTVNVIPDLDA